MIAAQEGRSEVIGTLVANGAEVNQAAQHGRTALMIAAQNGHNEVVEAINFVKNIDEVFASQQYANISEDMPAGLFIARYKSLLTKSGFNHITEKHIKNFFAEVTNTEIKESLIQLFAEGEAQIDLCCAHIFNTLYADVKCVSPIFLLLKQQGQFNINNPETLKEIGALESLYQQMGYAFNFQQALLPRKAEEEKKDDGISPLQEDEPHDLNKLKAEIHQANLKILTTNMDSYIAQASNLCTPEGNEVICLLKGLRSKHVLPNTLAKSLDKALQSYENHLENHVSFLISQNHSEEIALLKAGAIQQQEQLATQQEQYLEQAQKLNQLESLINQLLAQQQSVVSVNDTPVELGGDTESDA